MALEMIGPLLASMSKPFTATVIKSSESWVSSNRGTTFSMSNRKGKVDVRNISRDEWKRFSETNIDNTIFSDHESSDPSNSNGPSSTSARKADLTNRRATKVTKHDQQIIVSPVFKMVFLTVVAITILSGAMAVLMAFVETNNQPNQQEVFVTMNNTWKLGLGAIIGLLGGKTA